MFTSDEQKRILRYCIADTGAAMFFAFFGAVYEHFSHEVYSGFMIYAFAIPLCLGLLPLLLMLRHGKRMPSDMALLSWHAGLAALTVGSVFHGVLEIYGTTNRLIVIYPIVGITLCLIGAASYFLHRAPAQVSAPTEQ